MNNTISRNRLLKLADFLDKLPRERFDYGSWVGSDWKGKPDLSCGTTACALGWATTMPEFRRLGLRLTKGRPDPSNDVFDANMCVTLKQSHARATLDGSFKAASKVFGLSEEESEYLFAPNADHPYDDYGKWSPGGEATPKEVARHIRRFVKLYRKESQ